MVILLLTNEQQPTFASDYQGNGAPGKAQGLQYKTSLKSGNK